MAIEEALTSLLSGVASGRRYWGRAEAVSASAGAYLVINRISAPRLYAVDGPASYVEARFQVDAYAETFSAARSAASAALVALNGVEGTVAGTRILGIFIDSERDLSAADAGEVSHLYRRSVDFTVHYHE